MNMDANSNSNAIGGMEVWYFEWENQPNKTIAIHPNEIVCVCFGYIRLEAYIAAVHTNITVKIMILLVSESTLTRRFDF
jgi:hypothetical protein